MEEMISRDAVLKILNHNWGKPKGYTQSMEEISKLPIVQPKNGTLIIPLNESDFKSVKRIILDNKPWCRTFYEDVPGEASWIREEQPDGGEIYTCSHCGVTWQFNDGGPEENEAFFCPKCGFKMERGEAE